MDRIETSSAPAAIGPYSQATADGSWLFCSGQIALDPKTGAMMGETVEEQARQVLRNLGEVLAAGGSSFDRVLKTTIYLADMADFQAVNAIYAEAFGDARPARATVAALGLPKNALVEIDAIARRGA